MLFDCHLLYLLAINALSDKNYMNKTLFKASIKVVLLINYPLV